jgi:hypothetical protein
MSANDPMEFVGELTSVKDVVTRISEIDIDRADAAIQTDKERIMKCIEVT